MKKLSLILINLVILTGFGYSQYAADLFIENPTNAGGTFTFEIHMTPTTPAGVWVLGDCSWDFQFNNAALNSPVISYNNPALGGSYYTNSISTSGSQLTLVTDNTTGGSDGMMVVQGLKSHLYTVQFTITDPFAQTLLGWHSDTYVHTLADDDVTAVYYGDGDITLPVELSSFTALAAADGVHLNWTTESETDNLGFVLERRSGDESWSELASYKTDAMLEGQGSTSSATDYVYVDALVGNGMVYEYRLGDVDYDGVVSYHAARVVTVANLVTNIIPEDFALMAAYPNPFNPYTTINYNVPVEGYVTVSVYNQMGQLVRTLQNGVVQPGQQSLVWDARDENDQPVSAGVYLYNIEAGSFHKTMKMVLLK